MIVRSALTCNTCSHHHVVRIGLGHETRHVHRFPCRNCGEDIEVAQEVDFEGGGTRTLAVSNCTLSEDIWGQEIVNLDANFVVPSEYQGQDTVFPRLMQMHGLAQKAEEMGANFTTISIDDPRINQRPFRRPDYLHEWTELKRAWNLHRRGQNVFSRGIVKKISTELYPNEPLSGLADWLYRLTIQLQGRGGAEDFRAAADRLGEAVTKTGFAAFRAHYNRFMASKRGRRYLTAMSEYFDQYSDFAQVQFLVIGATPPLDDQRVASANFDRTCMFYGNTFELLADQIDIVAMLNNVNQGREYDNFAQLTLKKYYELDKSGRAACFAAEPALATFATEFDNQVRNASHHGGMDFDPATQIITYRAGKGGAGPEHAMTYTAYLVRCVRIFTQLLRLFTVELILMQRAKLSEPL